MSNIELKTDEKIQPIVIQMDEDDDDDFRFNPTYYDNLDKIKNRLQILEDRKKKRIEDGFESNKYKSLMTSLMSSLWLFPASSLSPSPSFFAVIVVIVFVIRCRHYLQRN
jgi:hypothetical protein